jgi:RNA recognition motif-containing protein
MLKVNNLPNPTTESDLRELFSGYKEIHIHSIETVGDKSIAYVELGNDEDEKDAIKKLNRSLWRSNRIYVDTFRGNKSRPGDPRKPGDGGSRKPEDKDTENN